MTAASDSAQRSATRVRTALAVGGVLALASLITIADSHETSSRGWTAVFAVLSVVAGILMLISPLWGVELLFVLLGASLIVLGIVEIVRALIYRRRRTP